MCGTAQRQQYSTFPEHFGERWMMAHQIYKVMRLIKYSQTQGSVLKCQFSLSSAALGNESTLLVMPNQSAQWQEGTYASLHASPQAVKGRRGACQLIQVPPEVINAPYNSVPTVPPEIDNEVIAAA
jgi:hypothetical protein